MNRLFILGAGASIDHSQGLLPGTQNFLVKVREAVKKPNDIDFYFNLDHEDIEWDQDSDGDWGPVSREPLSEESETTQRYLAGLYGIWVDSLGKKNWPEGWDWEKDRDYKKEQLLKRLKDINIEELLTLAIIDRQIDPSLPSEDHIINLIVETINYYSGQIDRKEGVYVEFVKQLNPKLDNIITFNWDTLLDELFSEEYVSIFRETQGVTAYHSKFLEVCTAEKEDTWDNADIKRPYVPGSGMEKSPEAISFGSYYIKLHGSINLVFCVNNLCANYQKPFIRNKKFTNENRCGACYEALKLYIIPPIQNKPIRDTPFIRRSWNKAQELCRSADQVVFWGYSLPPTDHWSNWLVKQIWGGRCKEIIIINPECFSTNNESFISRFCPKEKYQNKEIRRSIFKNFKEFLSSG